MAKTAGITAAALVMMAVLGIVILVGVILWMLWMPGHIRHSPSESGAAIFLHASERTPTETCL